MRIIATAVLCAASFPAAAHAEIIHFTNPAPGQPGHYGWRWESTAGWQSWLDVTRAPTSQSNVLNGDSVGQLVVTFATGANITSSWPGIPAADVAIDPENYAQPLTLALHEGATLGGHAYQSQAHHFNPAMCPGEPEPMSLFPEGERRFIGVRTSSFRYGWIEVLRTGESLTAFAWAYETQPGVLILAGQVPAPAAAALLGVASTLHLFRRRRAAARPTVAAR